MKIDIHIPWRDNGCEYRKNSFNFLYNHYSTIGNVITIDSEFKEFNRSNARNLCIKNSKNEIAIIIDADNYISREQILIGLQVSEQTDRIVRPFNSIHYLNREATQRFISDTLNFKPTYKDYEYIPPDGITMENSGGAYIVKKSTWERLGGMDEKFEGWGIEDMAFNQVHNHYYGEQVYIDGPNYNLHHPADRIASEKNWNRYIIWYKSGKIYNDTK